MEVRLHQAEVSEARMLSAITPHHVVEHLDPEHVSRLDQAARELHVGR